MGTTWYKFTSVNLKGTINTKKCDTATPLNPHDAFQGGCANVIKLKWDAKDGDELHNLNFCSLYSTVNYHDSYPVDHPEIFYKLQRV